jgi:hypothetical protein
MRSRLTYANVLSTVAVFIALGGGAYAATQLPANSVGTKQLKADAVKTGKVKNKTLLREDAAAGQFATPAQVAGRLPLGGTAANSSKLGGIAAAGFLQGTGHLVTVDFDKTADANDLVPVPGGGNVVLKCDANGSGVGFGNVDRDYDVYQSFARSNSAPTNGHTTVHPGNAVTVSQSKTPLEAHFDVSSNAGGAALTVWVRFDDAIDHCIGRARGLAVP